jgi:hypothetical protein
MTRHSFAQCAPVRAKLAGWLRHPASPPPITHVMKSSRLQGLVDDAARETPKLNRPEGMCGAAAGAVTAPALVGANAHLCHTGLRGPCTTGGFPRERLSDRRVDRRTREFLSPRFTFGEESQAPLAHGSESWTTGERPNLRKEASERGKLCCANVDSAAGRASALHHNPLELRTSAPVHP